MNRRRSASFWRDNGTGGATPVKRPARRSATAKRTVEEILADMKALDEQLAPVRTTLSELFHELTQHHLPSADGEEWEWLERWEALDDWKFLDSWERLKRWEGLEEWKQLSRDAPPLVAWYLSGILANIEDHLWEFKNEISDVTPQVAELERDFSERERDS